MSFVNMKHEHEKESPKSVCMMTGTEAGAMRTVPLVRHSGKLCGWVRGIWLRRAPLASTCVKPTPILAINIQPSREHPIEPQIGHSQLSKHCALVF
jgi:hypothetical protein